MKQRVYLETTIVSYLTARPSRDLILAAHQDVTRQWWERRREDFEVVVSQLVVDEAGRGGPKTTGGTEGHCEPGCNGRCDGTGLGPD